MERFTTLLLVFLFLEAHIMHAVSVPMTIPAFLWSHHGPLPHEANKIVDYRTISTKDLAKTVLTEGGWNNILCSEEVKAQNSVNFALAFIGRKLQSSDISSGKFADSTLIDFLKSSFTGSNFSMAFPYVVVEEKESLESSLISGFIDSCEHGMRVGDVVYVDKCLVQGKHMTLEDLHSLKDYIGSRMESQRKGEINLIFFCNGDFEESKEIDYSVSEGKLLLEIMKILKQSGATYSVLYASDPHRPLQYPTHRQTMTRFLAEGANGNSSVNFSNCDGVCQIKSSLLEGVLVGLVLLIIFLSGLCCMMGIDTPTRFETLQES